MKNQYVADVGDFGKYSLLRAFADKGVKIGVNWYLTENDGSNDGKFTKYLDDGKLRRYQPEIFDILQTIAGKSEKSVGDIQRKNVIPGALFYDEPMTFRGSPADREYERRLWFEESMYELEDAELIFMDPDNGLLESDDAGKLGAEKYVLPDEVESYFYKGHIVVYYCHKGRRTIGMWHSYKSLMFERLPEAKPIILTYHKGTQRSYVFLVHEKDYVSYRKIVDSITRGWRNIFTEEFTSKGDVSGEAVGDSFTLEKSDGSIVTIQKRADGQLQIKNSAKPGQSCIMNTDYFCSLFLW